MLAFSRVNALAMDPASVRRAASGPMDYCPQVRLKSPLVRPTAALLALMLAGAALAGELPADLPTAADVFAAARKKPLTTEELALRMQAFPQRVLEKPLLPESGDNPLADRLWPRRQQPLAFPTIATGRSG